MIGRRGFITGLVALVAAPAIVRAGDASDNDLDVASRLCMRLGDDRGAGSTIPGCKRVFEEISRRDREREAQWKAKRALEIQEEMRQINDIASRIGR